MLETTAEHMILVVQLAAWFQQHSSAEMLVQDHARLNLQMLQIGAITAGFEQRNLTDCSHIHCRDSANWGLPIA